MTYYLLDHKNPHAVGGFHGHAGRRSEVRLLAIHTTENAFDVIGPDDGAENVAAYLSRTERQASYHDIADSDSHVPCLPWDYTAFGARGFNAPAIHMAFAGQASEWHTLSDGQVSARLSVLASAARVACAEYGIPVRRLVGADARASGASGICGHADLDPDRRTDPGSGFPWSRFIQTIQENIMATLDDEDLENIADAVFARIWGSPVGRQDYTYGQAIDRIYRKVHSQQSGGGIDAQTAADLKVLADLGRKLAG